MMSICICDQHQPTNRSPGETTASQQPLQQQQQKLRMNSMSIVRLSVWALVLAIAGSEEILPGVRARAPVQPASSMTSTTVTATPLASTTANESPPLLDDPMNSSASTAPSDDNTDDPSTDDICVRCYDKVKSAQDLVETYEVLLRRQRKLINRKKAAVDAATEATSRLQQSVTHKTSRSVAASSSSGTNGFSASSTTSINGQNSTIRSRTLENEGEQIIVSRLRVARSPSPIADKLAADAPPRPLMRASLALNGESPNNKDKYQPPASMTKKDLDLERLRREMERQRDATCKALIDLKDCLEVVTRECIGNLYFHMYELFADQWHGKLRCLFPNNPKYKPLPGLRIFSSESETMSPVARPVSNPEAVRVRMHQVLNGGSSIQSIQRPLGVMLKPTLSNSALKQQQQQNQQQQPPMPYQGSVRDFSGLYFGRGIQLTPHQDDDSLNMVNVGKILLVPCCFAIMVALLALASLHYKSPEDEDEDGQSATSKC